MGCKWQGSKERGNATLNAALQIEASTSDFMSHATTCPLGFYTDSAEEICKSYDLQRESLPEGSSGHIANSDYGLYVRPLYLISSLVFAFIFHRHILFFNLQNWLIFIHLVVTTWPAPASAGALRCCPAPTPSRRTATRRAGRRSTLRWFVQVFFEFIFYYAVLAHTYTTHTFTPIL